MKASLTTNYFIPAAVAMIILATSLGASPRATLREGLRGDTRVFLLGDSVFDNNIYVPEGASVGDLLRRKQKQVRILARDGATLPDLRRQILRIPIMADRRSTYIFVSVGGNDILRAYRGLRKTNMGPLRRILKSYRRFLESLMEKFKDSTIILANLYYPTSPAYRNFYPLIRKWNIDLERIARDNSLQVLHLDKVLVSPPDFTHDIEPSPRGSRSIVKHMLKLLR
jgi:lysophospholipase L1-like esterase